MERKLIYILNKYYLQASKEKYNSGYFSLKGYSKLLNIDLLKQSILLIITATRNMGKSYGLWEFIDNEIWKKYNYEKRIIYIRTNQEKTKEAKNTFNARFNPYYACVGSIIYKLPDEMIEEEINGKKKKQYNKVRKHWKEIGRIVDVSNEHNFRSGVNSFENYCFAFWDEFNEISLTTSGLYEKFIMLFSTISRHNNPFSMVIVGNKIQANNDIFTNLELDTNHDYLEDFVQEIDKDIIYLDIGLNTFKHLNPPDSMVNRLAKFNENTNSVFNEGGFMVSLPANIIYKSSLGERTLKNYFTFYGEFYEYGEFLKDGQVCYYINKISEKTINEKIRLISLDLISHINNKNAVNLNEKGDYMDLALRLTKQQKRGNLFFTSFDAKQELELTLIKLINLFEFD